MEFQVFKLFISHYLTYTNVWKFGVSHFSFLNVFQEASYALYGIYLIKKYSKNRNIVKYLNLNELFSVIIYFKIVFILVLAKLNILASLLFLQCHMILQKSYANLGLKKQVLLL